MKLVTAFKLSRRSTTILTHGIEANRAGNRREEVAGDVIKRNSIIIGRRHHLTKSEDDENWGKLREK
jgi:hypothetical protein